MMIKLFMKFFYFLFFIFYVNLNFIWFYIFTNKKYNLKNNLKFNFHDLFIKIIINFLN